MIPTTTRTLTFVRQTRVRGQAPPCKILRALRLFCLHVRRQIVSHRRNELLKWFRYFTSHLIPPNDQYKPSCNPLTNSTFVATRAPKCGVSISLQPHKHYAGFPGNSGVDKYSSSEYLSKLKMR